MTNTIIFQSVKDIVIGDFVLWMKETKQLSDPYHIGKSNCQHFAIQLWGKISSKPFPPPSQFIYRQVSGRNLFCLFLVLNLGIYRAAHRGVQLLQMWVLGQAWQKKGENIHLIFQLKSMIWNILIKYKYYWFLLSNLFIKLGLSIIHALLRKVQVPPDFRKEFLGRA